MDFRTIALYSAGLIFLAAGLAYYVKRARSRVKLNGKLSRLLNNQGQYDFLLCDVRPRETYERSHLPGAFSFPLDEVDYLPVEDMFLTIVVYGGSAKESRSAARYLSDKGYFNVIDYGSIKNWQGDREDHLYRHISQFIPKRNNLNGKYEPS